QLRRPRRDQLSKPQSAMRLAAASLAGNVLVGLDLIAQAMLLDGAGVALRPARAGRVGLNRVTNGIRHGTTCANKMPPYRCAALHGGTRGGTSSCRTISRICNQAIEK